MPPWLRRTPPVSGAVPASHVREGVRLGEAPRVAEALLPLQKAHQPMGIVVDSDGQAAGIVTIKDLVEEIVGELEAW